MAFFDFPLEKLQTYIPSNREPKDFDAFWKRTLQESATKPIAAKFTRVDQSVYELVDVYDVTFNGYRGQPVKGWFIEPRWTAGCAKRPCLVTYIGYGGGRSLPIDHVATATAGIANFVMDTRGQGSTWAPGDTADDAGSDPQYPGFMTRGIRSPETYYYRRVFTDAVRAVQAAASHPHVDKERIGVTGGSQGGGIAIAAAALAGKAAKIAMPDVPFLCDYRRATTIVDTAPYSEITSFLKTHRGQSQQIYNTLDYFDGVNFAPRITARCLFSIALMDTVCPPSTCFGAFNRIKAKKEVRVYDFNNHEGGGPVHFVERLKFARKYL